MEDTKKLPRISAGILIYQKMQEKLKFFLVHPGGPYWKDKNDGTWSIPKGEAENGESNLLEVAKRELKEETGIIPPNEEEKYIFLGEIKQKSGKVVHAWAFEGDWTGLLMCKSFAKIEWPYKSGKFVSFPEVDKAGFFEFESAKRKINSAQAEFLERLEKILAKESLSSALQ